MLASASVANLDGADGAAMEALRDCVLAQVKHADERRRAAAVGCVGAVAAAGAGIAAKSYFDAIVSELEKKPKEWQARAGLCAALGALAKLRTDSEKAIGSMAVDACARLAASLKSEAQRDAKESATDALGDWLAHLPGPLPKDVADVCGAGIKDGKDGHGKRVLRVLVSAFTANRGLAEGAGAASLVKVVSAAAKNGAAKPSQRAEGAMSLFIIAAVAAVDDAGASDAAKEGTWTEAIEPNAAYFDPKAAAKLGSDDSEVLALTIATLLTHHGAHLAKAKAKVAAQRTCALLLLHPTSAVRFAARTRDSSGD
jgi:hypothetical protein